MKLINHIPSPSSPALLFLLNIALAILGLLCFPMSFWADFLYFCHWDFDGHSIKCLDYFWQCSHFHNILPIHEYERSFQFPMTAFDFFFQHFIVSIVEALVKFIPRHLIFLGYCEWNSLPDFFLCLFIIGIQKSYGLFVCSFCIQLLCQNCLLDLRVFSGLLWIF
jgi:hypothetical protein